MLMKKMLLILSACLFCLVSCSSPSSGGSSSTTDNVTSTTTTTTTNTPTSSNPTQPSNPTDTPTTTQPTNPSNPTTPSNPTPTPPTVPSYYINMNDGLTYDNTLDTTGYNTVSGWTGNKYSIVYAPTNEYDIPYYLLIKHNGNQYLITRLMYNNTLYRINWWNGGKSGGLQGDIYTLANTSTNNTIGYISPSTKLKIITTNGLGNEGIYKYLDTQNGYFVIINTNQ